jgi:hypothetical protein
VTVWAVLGPGRGGFADPFADLALADLEELG